MSVQGGAHRLGVGLPPTRRTLDVREQKRERLRRRPDSHRGRSYAAPRFGLDPSARSQDHSPNGPARRKPRGDEEVGDAERVKGDGTGEPTFRGRSGRLPLGRCQ
jgi:hypothetical protein